MPRIQQAYVYIACAIAIHMVVLGLANLVRVLAEIAGETGRVEPAPPGPQSIAFASATPLKRVGGGIRMSTPPDMPRVSYPEGLTLQRDTSPARWIEDALAGTPWATVGSLVPVGFEAYARVLHPAHRRHGDQRYPSWTAVRWSELAVKNGGTLHWTADRTSGGRTTARGASRRRWTSTAPTSAAAPTASRGCSAAARTRGTTASRAPPR